MPVQEHQVLAKGSLSLLGEGQGEGFRSHGFSMVELIVVMLLLVILAAFVAPRLQTTTFEELGFSEDTLAAIRYAHKVAITSGCSVLVTVTPGAGGGVALSHTGAGACAAGTLANPADVANPFTTTAPGGVTVAGTSFTYDMIGDPSGAADITITITNSEGSTRQITITDQTGFAFLP